MTDQLYGRAPSMELVRALMERSVNPAPAGERLPVLVFEGMRGSGKTALLNALAGLLDQRVPYARLDFEAGGQVRTEARRVLAAVAVDLSRRCPLYGRLRFPRLAIGQMVADLKADRNDPRRSVIAALRNQRRVDTVVTMLKDTAGQVANTMSLPSQVPVGLAGRALDAVVGALTAWGPGRRVILGKHQHWYGHRDSDDTADSVDKLVELNRWAHSRPADDDRRLAQQLLWAAFFADLRASFRRGPMRGMPMGCVILLDNADTPLGTTFLTQFLAARRIAGAEGGSGPGLPLPAAWPVTVVATSRGGLLADRPDADKADVVLGEAGAAAFLDGLAGRRRPKWLRYALPDLTEDEVADLAAARLRGRGPHRADKLTYEFTGGHPLSTNVVLAAHAEHGADADGLDALLDKPAPADDGAPRRWSVQERLCRGLLGVADDAPFPDTGVEYLTTCAAARDADEAANLRPPDGPPAADVRLTAAHLWPAGDAATGSAGPRVLRALLLRRLAGRLGDPDHGWVRVHTRLAEHCLATEDDTGRMYHRLATGEPADIAAVTAWLTARLPGREPWLPDLRAVTAAPHPGPRDSAPADAVSALTEAVRKTVEPQPVDPRYWWVLRLVAGLWVAADPLCGNDRGDLHSELAAWCRTLATDSPNRHTELRLLAREHDRLAAQWNDGRM